MKIEQALNMAKKLGFKDKLANEVCSLSYLKQELFLIQ
jgi:hypothetical protein